MNIRPASLVLALAFAFAAPAFAADAAASAPAPKGDGAVAEACKADIDKLCPGVQPGEGRIGACLKEHKKEVSKGCKQTIMKERKARKAGA